MTVRIVRIDKIQSNAGIAPHILVLDAALGAVDQNVLSIVVDPDRRYLRTPSGINVASCAKDFL